jgi:hypothetical protein
LPVLAASALQARQTLNFVKGIFLDVPRFAALVDTITSDTIVLKNRVDIQIRPASFRTIRGITAIAIIAEECSIWQTDDAGSKNPDKEILAAARPALATTGGPLCAIGSPLAKRGETFRTFQKHFGPDGNPAILVANGPTRLFNPTISQRIIDRAYEDDPAVASSEWGGEFRNDLEGYVSYEAVIAIVDRGCLQRERLERHSYFAHVDVSGGGADSFGLAIGHVEDGVGVLDCLVERRGPGLSPEATAAEFCETMLGYGINTVTGDNYGAGWTREQFEKQGVVYKKSDHTTSDYFANFLPILNSGRCSLLDSPRLIQQFCALERRVSRTGGKHSISHPIGGHDDIACAVAGLMVGMLAPGWQRAITSFHSPTLGLTRSEAAAANFAGLNSGDTDMPLGALPANSPQAKAATMVHWTPTRGNAK